MTTMELLSDLHVGLKGSVSLDELSTIYHNQNGLCALSFLPLSDDPKSTQAIEIDKRSVDIQFVCRFVNQLEGSVDDLNELFVDLTSSNLASRIVLNIADDLDAADKIFVEFARLLTRRLWGLGFVVEAVAWDSDAGPFVHVCEKRKWDLDGSNEDTVMTVACFDGGFDLNLEHNIFRFSDPTSLDHALDAAAAFCHNHYMENM